MKTTMIMHNIANPRRTTLSHLEDADEHPSETPTTAERTSGKADEDELPEQTANPRRIFLADSPGR